MAPPLMLSVTDTDDELDLLRSETSTLVARSAAATPAGSSRDVTVAPDLDKRVLRKRRPKDTSLVVKNSQPNTTKRKRTLSESAKDALATEKEGKRAKRDNKKLNTIVINTKRVATDAARRRWLHTHADLFEPLLPPGSIVLANLKKEVEASSDPGKYVPLKEIVDQPKLVVGGRLKDYQLHGLSFLAYMYNNGMNCILGDEMGLGKTLQTLSLLAYIRENTAGRIESHLIICPLSVVETWVNEIARWIPSFQTLRFHAQQHERTRLKYAVRAGEIEFDICITTYEGYVAEDSWFKSRRWTYVVLDEGHKIKNSETNVAHRLQGLGSMYRLVLTGTPVQNNLVELWGLLHWLYPTVFAASTERLFREAFSLEKGTYSLLFLKATEKLLAAVMLRRTKDSVEIQVPPREETTVFLPMAEAQRFWTYRLLTRLDTMDLTEIFGTDVDADKENAGRKEIKAQIAAQLEQGKTAQEHQWKRLMNLLMQLRQVCNHPYMLPHAEPTPYEIGSHIVASSSKLIFLDKLLADILPKGERVLIFSQWTSMLDLLEDFMNLRSIRLSRLDGSTTRPRRTLDTKLFQQEESPFQVFLISTKAGGLGINLTKASTVVMFDSDWNPQNDLQAIARAHRIGQAKVVKVYRLICQGSVEDQMLDRIRRKLFLSVKIMNSHAKGSDNSEDQSKALKRHELMTILRMGSSAISRAEGDGFTLDRFLNASIDEILHASKSTDDMRSVKLQKEMGGKVQREDNEKLHDAEDEEKRLLTGVAQVQSRLFEGKVVARVQAGSNKDIAAEWDKLQKRARQTRIIVVDGYEVLAEHLGPVASSSKTPVKPAPKTKKRTHEWEDWCHYCRDGGELVLCRSCPRVFHPKCHGLTAAQVKAMPSIYCSQHRCVTCNRSTADAGGMLFRCRTCPDAYCEDCLPPGDIDAVGDALPEFLLLGYGGTPTAYYIGCHQCKDHFEQHPKQWKRWQAEFRRSEAKLRATTADL